MARSGKGMAISMLILRILTLLLSAGCIVVFIINTFRNGDGSKTTFKDVFAYRYVFSTAVIGAAYSLLQLPFTVYFVSTEKRMITGRFLPEFDFYGDKIISFLLATGVGAGFAITFEFKKFLNADDLKSRVEKFLDRSYIATGLLLGAFVCMAVVSVISSINRKTSSGGFFS
ncbi:CASP-like protein [Melia azedarach]|uniref:CASP-like protein n=1 Tax=Melia azedarach TaxID=155640 RepID=A0ACC1XRR8_MELAZ|nr:CASP-like protein [Melia azedarach]